MDNQIVIVPGGKQKNYWKDIWTYRGLFYFLAWRDVLVRYKQTVIGIAWSVLRPLITIGCMWFIGWLFNSYVPEGVPRIILVCSATIPWQFFSNSFSETSNSLISNSNLLSKVYFPRLIIPASNLIVCLIDFLISMGILVILMVTCRFIPSGRIVFLPLFIILLIIISFGAGIFTASLNVKYRDFKYIVPVVVQFGLYISPIAFSSESIYQSVKIPATLKFIYSLNPMVGVIDGFRWCILGGKDNIYLPGFSLSVCICFISLLIGLWYFRVTERSFSDII